jgi:methionyl-tRNA formyltransferase
VRSAILENERETGVSIMLLNEKMDEGPIIAQRKVPVPEWPPRGRELDALLASEGGKLLAEMLPQWVAGEIDAKEQNHDIATYCGIFTKEDGLLDLKADPYHNLLKIRAFDGWPGTYTFFERAGKRIRVQVLDAEVINSRLQIMTVKPEGKGEMAYDAFLRSGATPA